MEHLQAYAPKLASSVKIKFLKEDERGRFYVIAESEKGTYLRVHEAGKHVLEMLDGHTTLQQINDDLKKRDIEIDLAEFVKLLGERGFLENYPKQQTAQKQEKLRVYNIPLFRNLGFLSTLSKGASPLFRKTYFAVFVAANLAVVSVFAAAVLLGILPIDRLLFLQNSFFLALLLYVVVIIPFLGFSHELAHAVACYHSGGRPKEIGVSVYLFTFLPYTDTSDALMLDKKKNILIFLAGPLMTLFVGNVCFMLYFLFPSPVNQLLIMLSFGAYLSVLFGFDPLIESDGYYVLQSLVDFPNLQSHAWSYATAWIKHKLKRLSDEDYREFVSTYSKKERKVLSLYAPITIIVNGVYVTIAIPLGILALGEYAGLTLHLFSYFPRVEALNIFAWAFESAYLSLGFVYFILRIFRIIARRAKK